MVRVAPRDYVTAVVVPVAAPNWGDLSTKHLHTKHANVGPDRIPFQVKVNIAANHIWGVKIKILFFGAFIEIKRC